MSLTTINRDATKVVEGNRGGLIGDIEVLEPRQLFLFPPIEDDVYLRESLTFKDGETSKNWYHTKGTGLVESEVVGTQGGQVWRNRLTFSIPSNQPEILQQAIELVNKKVLAIGKDAQGRRRMVGTLRRPALLRQMQSTSGRTRPDRPENIFSIEAFATHPALFLEALALPPGLQLLFEIEPSDSPFQPTVSKSGEAVFWQAGGSIIQSNTPTLSPTGPVTLYADNPSAISAINFREMGLPEPSIDAILTALENNAFGWTNGITINVIGNAPITPAQRARIAALATAQRYLVAFSDSFSPNITDYTG